MVMRRTAETSLCSNGQMIRYRIVQSRNARKLSLRVGPSGVEGICPRERQSDEIESFVRLHADWVSSQLRRIESLRGIRRPQHLPAGDILLRGEPTTVRIEINAPNRGRNRVTYDDACLTIHTGVMSQTPA